MKKFIVATLFAVSSLAQAAVVVVRAPVVAPRVVSTPVTPRAVSAPKPTQQVQHPVVNPMIVPPIVRSSCKDEKEKCR